MDSRKTKSTTLNTKIYRGVTALALIGFLIMLFSISTAFIVGDFSGEGSVILSLAWGKVSLIDVYIGFLIFSGWIIYRERSVGRSLIWVILMMIFGNMTACFYILIALRQSSGDWTRFWLGQRAKTV
ncbi:MAG: hypothetical protein AMJ88_03625 [Anaerolineae bacterium SM23_ 63]|nr:MAG: hypothetical protein AMJ88_03625 [Anaerolineae bacterium SM23_ 63]HEY48026.1 DUF1475 family protein [Anaerolineae bacterium]